MGLLLLPLLLLFSLPFSVGWGYAGSRVPVLFIFFSIFSSFFVLKWMDRDSGRRVPCDLPDSDLAMPESRPESCFLNHGPNIDHNEFIQLIGEC